MNRIAVFSTLVLLSCATGPTKEQSLVNRAADLVGGDKWAAVQTVTVKGSAKQWEPEQSDVPGGEMRFANEASFETVNDRKARTSRTDWERRFAYPATRTYKFSEIVTPSAGYVLGVDSTGRNAQSQKLNPPAHSMSGLRLAATQRESGRSAINSLILAMRANPDKLKPATDTVIGGASYPTVGYERYLVLFDPKTGYPARVRTLDYDNMWGDVTYDLVYSDWRDVGGAGRVPFNRRYELNGRTVMEMQYADARVNAPLDAKRFEVPAELRGDAKAAATGDVPYQWVLRRQFIGTYLDSDHTSYDARAANAGLRLNEVAPGVFHVVGGSHNSLLVELADQLVVVDAPVSDAQSLWVVNQAKQKFPGKPIKWLVLTHHHMDHAGGLRGYLGEGATLVVGQGAREHYRRVLAAPITRNPDMKPRDFSQVPIMEVPDSHLISDSSGRQVIAYAMQDNPHAKGLLMAYVPHAKLGFVTDVWTPGPALPDKPNPALVSVVSTVKRAGIQPERFAGGHGGTADYAPLTRLVGQ